MEKGMADAAGAAVDAVASGTGQPRLATVARPPTGEASIADVETADRPGAESQPRDGAPRGHITHPQTEKFIEQKLIKDERGNWSFFSKEQGAWTWDPADKNWKAPDGRVWEGPPPEEAAAILSEFPNRPPE
jgi:hypothetical protein